MTYVDNAFSFYRFTSSVAKTLRAMTGKLFFELSELQSVLLFLMWIILTYQIHLCSETINPVITVEVCGETKYTSAKSDEPTGSTKAINWKEHLFFEPRNRVSENFCGRSSANFLPFLALKLNRIRYHLRKSDEQRNVQRWDDWHVWVWYDLHLLQRQACYA